MDCDDPDGDQLDWRTGSAGELPVGSSLTLRCSTSDAAELVRPNAGFSSGRSNQTRATRATENARLKRASLGVRTVQPGYMVDRVVRQHGLHSFSTAWRPLLRESAMPWLETDPMTERLKFVQDALSDRFTMAEVCARHGVSRPTG